MRKLFMVLAVLMTAPPAGADCLRIHDIHSWRVAGPRELLVQDNFRNLYKVTLSGACGDLQHDLEVRSLAGGGLACMAPGDIVTGDSAAGLSQCRVARIAAMTPTHAAPAGSRAAAAVPSPALDGPR